MRASGAEGFDPLSTGLIPEIPEAVHLQLHKFIDLRTLDAAGIDYQAIGASLAKTGMLVVAEQAPACNSIGPRSRLNASAGSSTTTLTNTETASLRCPVGGRAWILSGIRRRRERVS
jgi:hypothetical protein